MTKHKKTSRDTVFANQNDMLVDFAFDDVVTRVFPDMIRRSVPGYDAIIPLLGVFAERYAQADSNIYDLGCSLGAATLAMRRRINKSGCQIISVDNSESMIAQCRTNLELDKNSVPVELMCEDILKITINNASIVVVNFTLQFIKPEQRKKLLQNIYSGLNKGGVLLIADKIVFDDESEARFQTGMHTQFKRANGYSELEIAQKRTALENILIPDTIKQHQQRLKRVGFQDVNIWFQCFNFVGICAIKS